MSWQNSREFGLALLSITANNENDENLYHSYVCWPVVSICPSRPRGDIFWVKILILTTLIFQKRQENQEDIHVIANQALPLPGNNYQEVGASSPKYTGKKRLNLQKFLKNWKTLS